MTQKNPSFTWQRDRICFLLLFRYRARGCCLHVHGLSLAGLLSGPPYTWTQSLSGQVCSAYVFRNGGTLCVRSWPTASWFSDSGTAPCSFLCLWRLAALPVGTRAAVGNRTRTDRKQGQDRGFLRCFSSVAHLQQAHPGELFKIKTPRLTLSQL